MGRLSAWINKRLPINHFFSEHIKKYYVHISLNFWYTLGAIALFIFMLQIVTGIFLIMYYVPTAEEAFSSIQFLMRDVPYGWLIRYMHVAGASFFFIIIYGHMLRALMYGSYKEPRELLWLTGVITYIVLMAVAYTGYVLPWGQMSYWATKVFISFLTVIPYVGDNLAVWLQGDFVVSGVVLGRFFAFHVVAFPLVLLFLVLMHIICLHSVGSNNPEGIKVNAHQKPKPTQKKSIKAFYPYYVLKDVYAVGVFLLAYFAVVFYMPTLKGLFLEHINQVPADPLVTPPHIHPVWYLSPYYAILRAIPDKLIGVILMFAAILIFFLLPWLDRSPVKSIRYKGGLSKFFLVLFIISVLALGYLGLIPASPTAVVMARVFTIAYFAYFILMPIYTQIEKCATPPRS